ncbi:MAG TPA: lactate racemase domain-containing protein [Kofleriaceae bacterium]|nr:lactate racemase domain-containing protein [Kofleriaceae bacterium]
MLPNGARVTRAPALAVPVEPVEALLRGALDRPIGAEPLERRVGSGDRVLVVVSDATRTEPRNALLDAALERIPAGASVTLAVATGTHGPCGVERLGLSPTVTARIDRWIDHDGADRAALVEIGTTSRGTPVALHRAVLDADLVVATGCIVPHYFAGYGAGIKAIFPGLGGSVEVRINHRLKEEPRARAGVLDGNPCREDLDEVADMLPRAPFLLDLVVDDGGVARAAVAGDVRAAFRAGAVMCEPLYRVRAAPARCVVVSGGHPVTASLYQASKLVAAAAPLVADGGTVIIVADCADGVGPLDVVNRGIYEIGLKPRLPRDHRVVLVSSLAREVVAPTYCEWAPSLEAALAEAPGGAEPLVLPSAARLLCEAA